MLAHTSICRRAPALAGVPVSAFNAFVKRAMAASQLVRQQAHTFRFRRRKRSARDAPDAIEWLRSLAASYSKARAGLNKVETTPHQAAAMGKASVADRKSTRLNSSHW